MTVAAALLREAGAREVMPLVVQQLPEPGYQSEWNEPSRSVRS